MREFNVRGRQVLAAMVMGPVIAFLLIKLMLWWFKI
jgi:hypothetical protein